MYRTCTLLSIFVLILFSFLISGEQVLATVGGPTYIFQIAYKDSDNSVYYLKSDMGGKGCPPIIHSVNLAKMQDIEVKTCDEVFEEYSQDYSEESNQKYKQFISDNYKNLSYLGSVSLEKNHIDVRIEELSEHIEDGEIFWTEFRATLTQDNKEVARLDIRGCSKDQPHIFEGYRIPNTDAMTILISNKGDCFEGGYVRESLSIVRGIKYYDTNVVRSVKEESATEPNTGNMVVYAASKDVVNDNEVVNNNFNSAPTISPAPQSAPKKNSVVKIILMAVIFTIGILIGYLLGRKSSRFSNPSRHTDL